MPRTADLSNLPKTGNLCRKIGFLFSLCAKWRELQSHSLRSKMLIEGQLKLRAAIQPGHLSLETQGSSATPCWGWAAQCVVSPQPGGWALKMSLSFAPLWHLEEIVLWFGVEKIINCLDRLQSSSSSPSLSSCKSSGNHFRRLFQKAIEGFECNSMAKLLGLCFCRDSAGLTVKHT